MRNQCSGLNFFGLSVILLTVLNCGGAHPNSGGTLTPAVQAQKDFLENYQFLVTKSEKQELNKCQSVEDVQKFTENFWQIRDSDPNTPENECKQLIDGRIDEIKNEILLRNVNTFGVSFSHNGGLNGEMARVYLLYGMPDYMLRLPSGRTYSEMMVWMYGDEKGHVLFRFLFYRKYGKFSLFKNHGPFIGEALKEISNSNPLAPQYIQMVWNELSMNDIDGNFRAALIQFSYYSDITIDKALKPPDPAKTENDQKVYNRKFKQQADSILPKRADNPQTQTANKIIFSKFNSSIPGYFNIGVAGEHKIAFYLILRFCDLDWEIVNDSAECALSLEIDFKNRQTKESIMFLSSNRLSVPKEQAQSQDKFVLFSNTILLTKKSSDLTETAEEMINKKLPNGNYTVRTFLINSITQKYAVWQEEISK
ncbi:MAG: hypothetical protein A2736_02910 [Candidatus Yanofskybacteria bacterium RIFCSPHIGHO2_01_FULL_41_27]|uniref:GWxTD domain-containing protein n=4 Tax=Parcubacteria group TaxID=1794811 RepID=A0A1F8HV14_9BACT|nr:MAG: hypothetical protein UU83_C0023G0009 [Candidatus Jorgensenbacteria bacterium GW2011_GWF2_41_8]KKS27773.1 MAG: hypothetical protein UU84_C0001G0005 [Candidatus Yanofskybacteria bacterium GW2011_GWC2_41_9]OGM99613.1 MAG: hypothetical protein A2736_02910 [Candidatus Yanofskybacteria bacterium RIFCSPHIGHO2_01_FULL_41_27]OGN41415.1 MAG: hypothetical protein A2606_02285 [Candidatus Yanofskybacteria bacterium RIFOXYD1_FULL_42_10]